MIFTGYTFRGTSLTLDTPTARIWYGSDVQAKGLRLKILRSARVMAEAIGRPVLVRDAAGVTIARVGPADRPA